MRVLQVAAAAAMISACAPRPTAPAARPEPVPVFFVDGLDFDPAYSTHRSIHAATWVAAGDSIPLRVSETGCIHDSCMGGDMVSVARWSVSDSAIAVLHVAGPTPLPPPNFEGVVVVDLEGALVQRYLVARSPGMVEVRAAGLRGPADTMPGQAPGPSAVVVRVRVSAASP